MGILESGCFFVSTVIWLMVFAKINQQYFMKGFGRKKLIKNCVLLTFISPFIVHIASQFVVSTILWFLHIFNSRKIVDAGVRNVKVMSAIIVVQFILIPVVINIYSIIINKRKDVCAAIYLTILSMITFMDEIAQNGFMFIFLTILIVLIFLRFFKDDIELISEYDQIVSYDNIVMVPIFAYIVVLSLAVLWNTVPVYNTEFSTAFSIISFTFCIFVFTTYKYAFGNYIKQVELFARTKEKKNMLEQQNKTQEEIILSLSEITEAKSGQTGKHVKRVSEYTRVLSEALKFSSEDVEKMRVASMMHDIGKLLIPSEILDKKGKLTDDEFKIIKTHAALGEEILHNTNGAIMDCAKTIALDHHERWDGNGYNHKKGEEISIEGRIVAVADVYDALVSRRSYKEAWDEQKAKKEIVAQSGRQFDPHVVAAFVGHYDEILDVWKKYKDVK